MPNFLIKLKNVVPAPAVQARQRQYFVSRLWTDPQRAIRGSRRRELIF
jgi:hypothetical protein